MESENKKISLHLIKGNETALVIENVEEAIRNNDYLAPSYTQAAKIIKDYIKQSRPIVNKITSNNVIEILYSSPQNIVAFSGARGAGKTSAMLSFAKYLEKNPSDMATNFVIMDPIDPTMMENDQNILLVVLSRLIRRAESEWNRKGSFTNKYQDKEQQKNKILKLAKSCLSGINSVKSGKADSVKTLDELQQYSDSAVLKQQFYDLVSEISSFCAPGSGRDQTMMILQIDDTDCQISKAYQVMEDIRKYLTIPNLAILMATNIDQMRLLFVQHYLKEFEMANKKAFLSKDEIKKIADQALIKLLPSAHRIYIPVPDAVFNDKKEQLIFKYTEREGGEDLLTTGTTLQSKVLNYIYQKTGLVFIAHSGYINDIVPNSLRELAYFLNTLSSLKDIPVIHENAGNLTEQIKAQLDIQEENLDAFEHYFLGEWVHSKLTHKMTRVIRAIAEQADEERIAYAYEEIKNYYSEAKKTITGRREKAYKRVSGLDQAAVNALRLDDSLKLIAGKHKVITGRANLAKDREESDGFYRKQEDFYNGFAVRTIISIKNLKHVCKLKRAAAKDGDCIILDESASGLHSVLMMNFWLPNVIKSNDANNTEITSISKIEKMNRMILNAIERYIMNASDCPENTDIRLLQNFALMIAINGEVQEVFAKEFMDSRMGREYKAHLEDGEALPKVDTESVKELYKNFIEKLGAANDGMLRQSCYKVKDIICEQIEISDDFEQELEELMIADEYEPEWEDFLIKALDDSAESVDTEQSNVEHLVLRNIYITLPALGFCPETYDRIRFMNLNKDIQDIIRILRNNYKTVSETKSREFKSLVRKLGNLSKQISSIEVDEGTVIDVKIINKYNSLASEIESLFE